MGLELLRRVSANKCECGRPAPADRAARSYLRSSAFICGSILMTDDLENLQSETETALAAAPDMRAWDAVRVATLGRNGRLTALLRDLGKTPPDQRRERGAALNLLKDTLTALIEARRSELESAELDNRLAAEHLDPTLPPRPRETGLIHPISRTMEEIAAIFGAMGCEIAEGPDVESDWMNFSALNIQSDSTSGPSAKIGRAHV